MILWLCDNVIFSRVVRRLPLNISPLLFRMSSFSKTAHVQCKANPENDVFYAAKWGLHHTRPEVDSVSRKFFSEQSKHSPLPAPSMRVPTASLLSLQPLSASFCL